MNITFNNILIIATQRRDNPAIYATVKKLTDFFTSQKCNIFLEKETSDWTKIKTPICQEEHYSNIDLLIVVGGDGSLLRATPTAIKHNIPVLGINKGRLGFLADITPSLLEKQLTSIMKGQYSLEQRFLLTTSSGNNNMPSCSALNEVLITHVTPLTKMIEFSIYIDDELMCSQRADGLIVATPTGSTAYALSSGGPILHPNLNAIVLVPMFSHTLSSRPIVITGDKVITFKLESKDMQVSYTCDSFPPVLLEKGEQLAIKKHKQKLTLIHPIDYNYYETLRSKLHWHNKH